MPESATSPVSTSVSPLRARAALLGDRLNIDRSGHAGVVSTAPFAYRVEQGYVVIFRYGAIALIGISPKQEAAALDQVSREVIHPGPVEEERIGLEIRPDHEEGLGTNGLVQIRELTPAHALVLADILAKSAALAHYEKEIAAVFDTIEPAAKTMADTGRIPKDRKSLLRLVGSALLTQHRVSGRMRLPKSRKSCGSGQNWNGFMPGWKMNSKSWSAARCSTAK